MIVPRFLFVVNDVMHRDRCIFILASTMLALGGLIYILFREEVIFTSWLRTTLHINPPICGHIVDGDTIVGYIILFSLADALWYGALLLFDLLLRSDTLYSRVITLLTTSFPFIFELLQLCHIIPGTFDCFDILTYLLTLILFLLCSKKFYFKH